jgi:hypothetical protein
LYQGGWKYEQYKTRGALQAQNEDGNYQDGMPDNNDYHSITHRD